MMKSIRRIISIILIVAMMMQLSHLENYRYINEVLAASMTTEESLAVNAIDNNSELSAEELEELSVMYSYATIFPWKELSVSEGIIEGDYDWTDAYKLTSDLTIKGNLNIQAPLNLNGYSLTVEGNVEQYYMTAVNGDLIVYGNYDWQAGNLVLDEGYLYVEGNFTAHNDCSGKLAMQNTNDYMLVAGDIVLSEENKANTYITAGTIDLKGNFVQKLKFNYSIRTYPEGDFSMEQDSILLLSGDGSQNIYVSKGTSGFEQIMVNTEGLEKDENEAYIFGDRQIGFSGLCNYESYEDNGCPTTYGYMTYKELPEEGNYIYGSCYYIGEPIELNRSLTVIGDFIQNAGLYTNGYSFHVAEDYRIQSIDENGEYGETEGFIDTTKHGYIYVYNNFYTQSVVDHSELLKNGTWTISGNLYQIGEDAKNFTLEDSSNTIKMGDYTTTGETHVVMDNPLENTFFWLRGNSNVKMYFDKGVCVQSGYAYSYLGFMYYTRSNSTYYGDVKVTPDITKISSGYITGDVTIQADVEVVSYFHVIGDVVVENGTVTISEYGIEAENISFKGDSSLVLKGTDTRIDCEDFRYEGNLPLVMEGDSCSINCNDFYYASNSSSGKLINGQIMFTGDFFVKDVGTPDSFVSSENHKLYARGSNTVQHITIENPASCIETLDVYNGTGGLTISAEGTVIHHINNYSHSYVWEGIEGYTLEQDMVYDEDLVLYTGTLDLNGHTLTVNGDFIAANGVVDINGGHLIVNGDMNLAYRDWSTEEPAFYNSTVDIIMDQEQDQIDIVGDWYANFYNHSLTNMTSGIVTLNGNMNIDGYVTSSQYTSVTETIMSGTSLHLTGTEKQTITGVSTQVELKVGDFIVENESEIAVELPVYVGGEMQLPEMLKYTFYSVHLDDLGKLTNHVFKGDLTAYQSSLMANTQVEGVLYIEGTTDLQGYNLTADKISVKQPVTLSKGKIKTNDLYVYEKIYMQQEEDVIETDYMYVNMTTSDSDYMTNGNIYIVESFQDSTSADYAFLPSGDHTVIFTKTDSTQETPVKIRFANSESILNRVVLYNLLNCYSLNREKEQIANEVVFGYEDTEKPATPENVTSSEVGCFSVKLSWDEATDDVEVYRYKIYRNGKYLTRIKGTSYVDVVLKPNTTYRYTISVLDAVGNESEQTPVLEVTTAQDTKVPYYNQAPEVDVNKDAVTINCNKCFVDDDSYVDYYILTKNGEEVARVSETAYITYTNADGARVKIRVREGNPVFEDTGLEYGVSYKYGIQAVDFVGNVSTEYTFNVMADLPPTAPEEFTVTSENGFNIISFRMSGTEDVSYYCINDGENEWAPIYNSSEGIYTYVDKSAVVGETYEYFVRPYNKYRTGGTPTETIEVTTVAESTPPVIHSVAYSTFSEYINESLEVIANAADESALDSIYAYIVKSGEEERQEIYRKEVEDNQKSAGARFTFDVEGLEGEHELHIVAVDHCGNESEVVKTCKINMGGLPAVEMVDTKASASAIYMEWKEIAGASYYSVEKKEEDGYVKQYKTSDTQIRIDELNCDTEYTYRVVAYDADNGRGISMDGITITTTADTTIPWFTSVYGDDKVLGSVADLTVKYEDDVQVAKLYTYYRNKGTSDWNLIGENTINRRSGTVYVKWDKTGLTSGLYEVRYVLEDTSGNLSVEEIKTYNLDLAGPSIQNFQVAPQDWALQADWETFVDEDYSHFELKRISVTKYNECTENNIATDAYEVMVLKGVNECTFSEQISPEEEYMYRLYAYDHNGNVSVANSTGRSIDNDIFAPVAGELQGIYAAKGYAVSLEARGCYDNDEIVSYEWDMGNGDIISGENCEYIYREIGTYTMKLTVTDGNGNQSVSAAIVTVGEDVGVMKVKVVSGTRVLSGADVVACVNGEPYHSGATPQTDSQGMLEFPIQAGTYKIAAYKSGYLPSETEVTVKKGENKEVVINLEEGDMVTADFTTKEMSKEELEEAGIDTTTNKAVFEYTLELEYKSGKIEVIEFNNWLGNTHYTTIGGNHGTPGYEQGGEDDTDITITNVSGDPAEPVFVTTKTQKINIDWLQNIYQVDVTISNYASEDFTLEETQATLLLENGLGLAEMKQDAQPQTWDIGTLKSGESVDYTWYVGAKKTGSYPLKIQLDALLQPYNLQMSEILTSANKLAVTVGKGLHLYIYPEESAYIGEQYYVQFKLANESDETYHNVTASFGKFETITVSAKVVTVNSEDGTEVTPPTTMDTGVAYFVEDETSVSTTLDTNDRLTVETLEPGKSMYGTWRFQFDAAGGSNEDYYRLVTKYAEYLDVSSTNVKVTIEPVASHLSKKVISIKVPEDDTNVDPVPPSNADDKELPDLPSADDYKTDPTETVKDPINLMTGAFTTNHVVAAVAGGTDIQFGLFYNSLYTDAVGDFGKGWYHNYEMHLERQGSLITLYRNPYEILYFAESEDTKNVVCGTVEDNAITLLDDSVIKRTYYQVGSSGTKYRIEKNAEGYILYSGNEQFIFDVEGNLSVYINENGKKQSVSKNERSLIVEDVATGKSVKATYNEEGRIVSVQDAAGNETTFQYENDCMTVLTSKLGTDLIYEYDESGHILVGKEGDGTVYVENTFDKEGRILTQVANGKKAEITKFSYAENKDDETTTVTMTNADGTTEQAVADKYGQGIRYVDAIGGIKEYTYNEYFDMTSYHYANGTGATYSYDENGNITKVVETTGKTTDYTYDKHNRVTRVVCNDGTDISYTYNENGQMVSLTSGNGLQAEYTYNENGQILTETSSLGTMEYTYEKGMLRCLKDYSGNYHYFTYDDNGNVIQYIDGAGVVTNYKIDVSGRVEEETIVMEDGTKSSTQYTYDAYGNVTAKTDANNTTTQYVYNEEDLLEKEIRPDGKAFTYSYDQNGNITKIVCPDGVTTAESVYDAAGNALSLTDTLKSIQKAGYSVGGQLLTMTQANGGEIKYTYYENGLLESQTDANGNKSTLVYDIAGRISSVTDGNGATTAFGYDIDGNLSSVENALGNSVTMEYNKYRKVTSQKDAPIMARMFSTTKMET